MKGINTMIAFVLVIAISIAAITVALSIGNPSIQKGKEILVLDQGKENIKAIDNAIQQVLQEGDGSSRVIGVNVMDGSYELTNNNITFVMRTEHEIVGEGVSGTKDGLYFEGRKNEVIICLLYTDFDVIADEKLGTGMHNLYIVNSGGMIYINPEELLSRPGHDIGPIP